jgi:hypothetical protein
LDGIRIIYIPLSSLGVCMREGWGSERGQRPRAADMRRIEAE